MTAVYSSYLLLKPEQDVFFTLLSSTIVLLSAYLWKNSRSASNPFTASVPNTAALQKKTDHDSRLLRVAFKQHRVPENIDAIVIGSGMGGLAAAGCLARAGKKVLVLEQHDRAGGSTHTFTQRGFEFDVGVHYVGEMNPGSMNRTIMDKLTDEQLAWDIMDKEFDRLVLRQGQKNKTFSCVSGEKDYINQLVEYFPEEKNAIMQFVNLLKQSQKAVAGYVMMKQLPVWLASGLVKTGIFDLLFAGYSDIAGETVKSILDRLTQNDELKFVLGYAFGDYGTFPSEAPFLMHGILMKHFEKGAYYPKGGSSELACKILPGILRGGGAVLVRACVTKILINIDGAVSGVRVSGNGTDADIHAPIVISSAGLHNTYLKLLPKQVAEKQDLTIVCKELDKGMSCFQTFIGLRGTAEELGLKKRNYWMYNSIHVERAMREFLSSGREQAADADIPLMFASFPSTKDSTWESRHAGLSVCVVVTFVNWAWFEEWHTVSDTRRSPEYNQFKQALERNIWKAVLNVFPQLEHKVEYIDSGTPLSHNYYLFSPRGGIYGIDHTMKRFKPELAIHLRPKTDIPGLFLTGQDVFTCGVMGAVISGMMTSGAILGRNHFIDLFVAMSKKRIQSYVRSLLRKKMC